MKMIKTQGVCIPHLESIDHRINFVRRDCYPGVRSFVKAKPCPRPDKRPRGLQSARRTV
jgi:hypothetical protein